LDDEMAMKIARHRQSRSPAWVTAEVPVDLTAWLEKHGPSYRVIVIDCLTMWLSNQCGLGSQDPQVLQQVRTFLQAIRRLSARVVIVTNELGMSLVPGDAVSRRFRELNGSVNRLLADQADEAYMVVSGMPLRLK
jgi:adenosylcobinamide kinase/adenosylcobinamide-phosphate guanylyltransferase